jgi:hypothetical protein
MKFKEALDLITNDFVESGVFNDGHLKYWIGWLDDMFQSKKLKYNDYKILYVAVNNLKNHGSIYDKKAGNPTNILFS